MLYHAVPVLSQHTAVFDPGTWQSGSLPACLRLSEATATQQKQVAKDVQ